MSLPDLVVKVSSKDKTAMAKTFKAMLSMKEQDPDVKAVRFMTPCIEGEFDEIGWVAVPPIVNESLASADRTFHRSASWEEGMLGADKDNQQTYRVKDGVEQRRVGGAWVKSLGITSGKSTIPAHVHVFGHKDGDVKESLGSVLVYNNSEAYVVAVQTKYGPVPRVIRVVTQ